MKRATSLVMAAVVGLGIWSNSAPAAILVQSFETSLFDGVESAGNDGTGGIGTSQAASTIGVTDGVQSVALTIPASTWYWDNVAQLYGQVANLSSGNTTLEMDVTGGESQGELFPIINSGAGWWQIAPSIQWNPGVTTHMTWDLTTQVNAITANPGWGANIEIGVNAYNTAQTIYIDNIQLTPEPASLGILAMSVLMTIRRRR